MITGGEPLLAMPRVLAVLEILREYDDLTVKALYTHGGRLLDRRNEGDSLQTVALALARSGLGCVNLSVHHYEDQINNGILRLAHKPSTLSLTKHLRAIGLPIRLNLTLQVGGIDTIAKLIKYIEWGSGLGANDIYVRELFSIEFASVRTDTDRNPKEYTRSHHVSATEMAQALSADDAFSLTARVKEHDRDKTEWRLIHRLTGRPVYLSSLSVGTEHEDGAPYLVLMPDGQLYRGWLGAQDLLANR